MSYFNVEVLRCAVMQAKSEPSILFLSIWHKKLLSIDPVPVVELTCENDASLHHDPHQHPPDAPARDR